MPVDISSLYTAAGGLKRPAAGAPASNSNALPLALGERAQAQVLKSTPLNAALSAKLLTGGNNNAASNTPIAAPASNTSAPANAESARTALLNTYRGAVARNEMHLAALLIKGKSVTTVIDKPLVKGQLIEVYLTPDRRLTALNTKFNIPNVGDSISPKTAALLAALKPVLRELMPRQGQQDLLSQLRRLPTAPTSVTQAGADKSLTKLLSQIDQLALNLNAPPSGKAVREALEQSGTLLEPRLARAVQSTTPDTAVRDVLARDLKAALLQYLAPTKSAAGAANPQTSASANAQTASPPLAGEMALPSLMQMLSNHSVSNGGESLRMLQTQLVLLMHQLSLNTLARVRLNQLQPESKSTRSAEASTAPVHLTFDIPVRLDSHLYPAHIEIEEQTETEQTSDENTERSKLWQVNLTLDPPGIGEFFVRLRLRNEQLSLAFWSEQAQTLSKAQQAFTGIRNTLARHDIEVRDVQYHQGVPPHKGNKLSYHLVDVKT
ncbi:flagellar hook-length control protein FliK [Gilvimarinus polysaccharolyticus]|uniref:flagellar hook-length control protein FliK n=1 Tax=Gilvimarinus polysaccharolyticus TaxID=863921 RepID=UPI000673AD1F|nr:flagellar hook-length control protein FliK [Gilvimarinus polysaccharolyticus]